MNLRKENKLLKDKKERLFELERLKFDKTEKAYELRESLRAEILIKEKEIEDYKKSQKRGR
jgi:hypothetical protein